MNRAGILIGVLILLVEAVVPPLGCDQAEEGRNIVSLPHIAFFATSAVFLVCNLMFTPIRDARGSQDLLLEITC